MCIYTGNAVCVMQELLFFDKRIPMPKAQLTCTRPASGRLRYFSSSTTEVARLPTPFMSSPTTLHSRKMPSEVYDCCSARVFMFSPSFVKSACTWHTQRWSCSHILRR